MSKLKAFSKKLMKNNKGQGMVEYILLLVVVVAIVTAFKGKFLGYIDTLREDLQSKISSGMETGQ